MIWIEVDEYVQGRALRGNVETTACGNRPNYGGGWFLKDELHEWLMVRIPTYQLVWDKMRSGFWHIGVQDSSVAILFKLTFGGVQIG
jgi:hypothetical protein